MNKYMLIFRGGAPTKKNLSPETMQLHMQKWNAWFGKMAQADRQPSGDAIQEAGKVLSGQNKVVSDGPFGESKDLITGYAIVRAKSLDDATEVSKDCPIFEYDGVVEVRLVLEM